MQDHLTIVRLEQLEAVADPLRQRLLRAFCCRTATTKQVAETLGEKPSRLYHHVEVLEKAGLLRLVRTQPNRGTLEKYYTTVALRFEVDRELLRAATPEMLAAADPQDAAARTVAEGLRELQSWQDSGHASESGVSMALVLFHECCKLTESQARAVVDRLRACLGECLAEAPEGEPGRRYSVTVAFHESPDGCCAADGGDPGTGCPASCESGCEL